MQEDQPISVAPSPDADNKPLEKDDSSLKTEEGNPGEVSDLQSVDPEQKNGQDAAVSPSQNMFVG